MLSIFNLFPAALRVCRVVVETVVVELVITIESVMSSRQLNIPQSCSSYLGKTQATSISHTSTLYRGLMAQNTLLYITVGRLTHGNGHFK